MTIRERFRLAILEKTARILNLHLVPISSRANRPWAGHDTCSGSACFRGCTELTSKTGVDAKGCRKIAKIAHTKKLQSLGFRAIFEGRTRFPQPLNGISLALARCPVNPGGTVLTDAVDENDFID
jgi:hypothetical protein